MRYIDLPVGDYAPEVFNVVVEAPKGSTNKYEYEAKLNIFRLDGALGSLLHYPGEYGFVPRTEAADAYPLDALVLTKSPTFPGCIIEARAIGIFVMVEHGVEDLKLICVPACEPRLEWLTNYRDLGPHDLNEIKHFFRVYKEMDGKDTVTQSWQGPGQARKTLVSAIEQFKRTQARERVNL
jgi:inorganic pyrophosphatase